MTEREKALAQRHEALSQDGVLKNGFSFRSGWVGKEDREVLQLIRTTVVGETRYGNGIFHSRIRLVVVGQIFV